MFPGKGMADWDGDFNAAVAVRTDDYVGSSLIQETRKPESRKVRTAQGGLSLPEPKAAPDRVSALLGQHDNPGNCPLHRRFEMANARIY
jgi:hypothetical protein